MLSLSNHAHCFSIWVQYLASYFFEQFLLESITTNLILKTILQDWDLQKFVLAKYIPIRVVNDICKIYSYKGSKRYLYSNYMIWGWFVINSLEFCFKNFKKGLLVPDYLENYVIPSSLYTWLYFSKFSLNFHLTFLVVSLGYYRY